MEIALVCVFLTVLLLILFSYGSNTPTKNFDLEMQKLWMDHVAYTREYIIRFVYDLPAVKETATRLLQNQDDLAHKLDELYPGSYETVRGLLREHITIAVALLNVIAPKERHDIPSGRTDRQKSPQQLKTDWMNNATSIARALSGLNPKYSFEILNDMMQSHLVTTTKEIGEIIAKRSGIPEYDEVVKCVLDMSRYLTYPS